MFAYLSLKNTWRKWMNMINICVQQLTNPTICKMRQTCPLVANQQRLVVSSITEVMFTYFETYHNDVLSFLHVYRVFWVCASLCFTCTCIIYDFRKGTTSNLMEKICTLSYFARFHDGMHAYISNIWRQSFLRWVYCWTPESLICNLLLPTSSTCCFCLGPMLIY